MFYLENKCNLNDNHVNFLQHVLSADFPWYFQREKNHDESFFYFLVHTLMHRNSDNQPVEGNINSPYYNLAIDIFNNFCSENQIEVGKVLRAAFNCTYYSPYETTRIHTDHNFEHNNFIFYVNEFSKGQTCIFNKDNIMLKQVEPELHKAVVFSGEPHAHNFCNINERRIILVVTFESATK